MPDHALYYPEWGISDPVFLSEALLYWDRLAVIVPEEDFGPMPWHKDPAVQKVLDEAHERFVTGVAPTAEQKARAHEQIQEVAEIEPPEWCRPENLQPHRSQVMSARKVAPETLNLLEHRGWMSSPFRSDRSDLRVISHAAANLILGKLADECGSQTMPPITNDPGSFSANCNLLLSELGSRTGVTFRDSLVPESERSVESDYAFLMTKIPYLGLNRDEFDPSVLRRIVEARDNPEIDGLREVFRRTVDEYLEKIRTVEDTERKVIGDEFGQKFTADIEVLKRELRRAGLRGIWRKEGIVAVVVGAVTGAVSLGIGTICALTGGLQNYQQKRRDAFEKHWSSWVFSIKSSRLTLW